MKSLSLIPLICICTNQKCGLEKNQFVPLSLQPLLRWQLSLNGWNDVWIQTAIWQVEKHTVVSHCVVGNVMINVRMCVGKLVKFSLVVVVCSSCYVKPWVSYGFHIRVTAKTQHAGTFIYYEVGKWECRMFYLSREAVEASRKAINVSHQCLSPL